MCSSKVIASVAPSTVADENVGIALSALALPWMPTSYRFMVSVDHDVAPKARNRRVSAMLQPSAAPASSAVESVRLIVAVGVLVLLSMNSQYLVAAASSTPAPAAPNLITASVLSSAGADRSPFVTFAPGSPDESSWIATV